MRIDAGNLHFQILNEKIKETEDTEIIIDNCIGQRFIAAGLSGKNITINGVPGNALGCYLDDCVIRVNANAQDATGDTMNEGKIIIHGSSGDATGYGMRGGKIYIEGDTGYRAGIHMKSFKEKNPVLIIGGVAGSFLGEYQAGGTIVVLGINNPYNRPITGDFCATGMHGGKIYLCTESLDFELPQQVIACKATKENLDDIADDIEAYCNEFGCNKDEILNKTFYLLTPNSKNPYKQLYNYY